MRQNCSESLMPDAARLSRRMCWSYIVGDLGTCKHARHFAHQEIFCKGLSFLIERLDRTLQADRDGRHLEFAEAFDRSEQRSATLLEVDRYATTTKNDLSPETLRELSVQRATTNGFLFTLKTLIKVPPLHPPHPNPFQLHILCKLPKVAVSSILS